jgi:hypothetical protein
MSDIAALQVVASANRNVMIGQLGYLAKGMEKGRPGFMMTLIIPSGTDERRALFTYLDSASSLNPELGTSWKIQGWILDEHVQSHGLHAYARFEAILTFGDHGALIEGWLYPLGE